MSLEGVLSGQTDASVSSFYRFVARFSCVAAYQFFCKTVRTLRAFRYQCFFVLLLVPESFVGGSGK